MGCDIHVMIERKFDNRWINVDNWRVNPYKGEEGERDMEQVPVFHDRNYELFSFLADVRNYGNNPCFGFDRGFPKDASEETRNEYERWGSDAHTPGYATLAELKEKASTVKEVRREGAVLKEQADRYRETGQTPDSWAQGVGCWKGIAPQYRDKYEWLSWTDEAACFDRLINSVEERKRDVFWIFDPHNDDGSKDPLIRIVFWFDN